MIVYSTRNHGIISHIYTHPSIHPSTLTPPNQQKKLHQTHHLLKGTSSILVVRLLGPHIPIMAHSIPILVDWRLTTNSSRISSVARAHVSRGSVCWERIGILVGISPVLWLALPELA